MSVARTNQHVYGERAFWVKKEEARMIKERTLTVILREKDRSDQVVASQQWLPLFTPVPVYFLDVTAASGGPLGFEPDEGTTVQVVRRTVGRLGDLKDGDLRYLSGTAVPRTAADVSSYFGSEMSPGKAFGPETVVTVYWIEYLPDEAPATD